MKARKQCHLDMCAAVSSRSAEFLLVRMQVKMRRCPLLRSLQCTVRHVGANEHMVQLDIPHTLAGDELLLTLTEFQRQFQAFVRMYPQFQGGQRVLPRVKKAERPLLGARR